MGKPPFHPRDKVGQYTIEQELNVGNMGAVYTVVDKNIVIKAPFIDSGKVTLDQFRKEVTILQTLNHPGISGIVESDLQSSIPWYATESIVEGTLRKSIETKAFSSPVEICRIILGVAEAMGYAHTKEPPVLHRHLRPENIGLKTNRPALLDFGLANFGSSSGVTLVPQADILYMAPEQMDIRGKIEARSEVYTLGVIFYEMLTGYPPFGRIDEVCSDDSRATFVEQILDPAQNAAIPDNLEERLQAILQKSLQKDKQQRYANIKEMSLDLKDVFKDILYREAQNIEQKGDFQKAISLVEEAVTYGLEKHYLQFFYEQKDARIKSQISALEKSGADFRKSLQAVGKILEMYSQENQKERKQNLQTLLYKALEVNENTETWKKFLEDLSLFCQSLIQYVPEQCKTYAKIFIEPASKSGKIEVMSAPPTIEAKTRIPSRQIDTKTKTSTRLVEEALAMAKAAEDARIRAAEDTRALEIAKAKAIEDARIKAVEDARIKAVEDARIKAAEDARIKAAEDARIKAAEDARAKESGIHENFEAIPAEEDILDEIAPKPDEDYVQTEEIRISDKPAVSKEKYLTSEEADSESLEEEESKAVAEEELQAKESQSNAQEALERVLGEIKSSERYAPKIIAEEGNFTEDDMPTGVMPPVDFFDLTPTVSDISEIPTKTPEVEISEQKGVEKIPPSERPNLPAGFHWLDGHSVLCEKDNSTMIFIPAGTFIMGSEFIHAFEVEKPEHEVYLDNYCIDKYPVTWSQYLTFCEKTGYEKPKPPRWGTPENHPVVNISWTDAVEYCRWCGKSLPTEAQWEKSGKGGIWLDGDKTKQHKNSKPRRKYPWGDDAPNSGKMWRANYDAEPRYGKKSGTKSTSPINKFAAAGKSPYGVIDLAGNVWEWCQDWFEDNYYSRSPSKNPTGPEKPPANNNEPPNRVLRGGSWFVGSRLLRVTARRKRPVDEKGASCGMRGALQF